MTINLFQTSEYRTLIQTHICQSIDYLFQKNQEFSLACEIKHVIFSPELPSSIQENFDDRVLFVLSGYTFESAQLEEDYFSFEAGFGSENFGSTVSVPLLAIKQIFVGDNPIMINLAQPALVAKETKRDKASNESSMEALLNNPENKKLLNKKKES